MNAHRTLARVFALGLLVLAASMTADAKTFYFTGTVEQCTPTCNSFAFLGTNGLLDGFVTLDDTGIADGTYEGGDVTNLSFRVIDPALPLSGPSNPPDPATDNPFVVDQTADGGGIVVANGQPITNPRGTWPACPDPAPDFGCVRTSAGATDGTTLTSGFIDFWLTQGLLANNGAVITLRFDVQCLDELTPGAVPIPPPCFEVNIFEGQIFVAGGAVGSVTEILSADQGSLDFGDVTIGSSRDLDLTLTNNVWSGADAGLTGITPSLSGPSAGEFAVGNNTCDDAPPLGFEQTCTVTTSYVPTLPGAQAATLTVPFTELDNADGSIAVPLSGTGVIAAEINVDPPALVFGNVELGASVPLDLTVSNEGTLDLTISGASLSGAPAGDYALQNDCGVLGAGETCTMTVTFAPTVLGDRNATLTITSDDADEGSLPVALLGTGVQQPDISLPSQLDFGAIATGTTSDLPLTISNNGAGALTISGVGTPDALAAPFSIASETCTAQPVAPSGSCIVTVHFAPANAGAFADTFSIESDDPDSATLTVTVLGVAQGAARISVDPGSIDFGTVPLGLPNSRDITVRNVGVADLTISSVTESAGDFVVTQDCAVLAPGDACTIDLTYTPSVVGAANFAIDIASSDPDAPLVTVPVTATAGGDADGVDESVEDGAPNGGDGNADGVPDRDQPNVASLPDTAGAYVTIVSEAGSALESVSVTDNGADAPDGVTLASGGFVGFAISGLAPGATTTVDLIYTDGTTADRYFKFGATADDGSDHLYEFQVDGETGAQLLDGGAHVVLTLVDGARGDSDLAANGVIVDPGVRGTTIPPTAFPGAPLPPSPGNGQSCFIATAAYGSYLDPHVMVLRHFRDAVLLTNDPGRAFVRFYYAHSPPIADYIRQHDVLRAITRVLLTPLVYGFAFPDTSLLVLSIALAFSFERRRRRDAA